MDIRKIVQNIKDKLVELRKSGISDSFELEVYFINNMSDIYDLYPSLIKRLCRDPNLDNSFLDVMINMLEKVDKGEKTLEHVELKLGNELANKFIYPHIKK
jgi:hypothetical protein